MNYQPKNLCFDQEGRERLVSGIEQIAKAVKSTLGPRGNTVLIESNEHTHGITVTKDGVTVARSIEESPWLAPSIYSTLSRISLFAW